MRFLKSQWLWATFRLAVLLALGVAGWWTLFWLWLCVCLLWALQGSARAGAFGDQSGRGRVFRQQGDWLASALLALMALALASSGLGALGLIALAAAVLAWLCARLMPGLLSVSLLLAFWPGSGG